MKFTHLNLLPELLRFALGGIFFWAFLDKVFGLGFSTLPEKAWMQGGSPTQGFLFLGTHGPFAGVFQSLAGSIFVDALFMTGLLLIGLALILGIGMRVAGVSGALLMSLMYLAAFPPKTHPFLDDHIVYALTLLWLGFLPAGERWGFGGWWKKQRIVKKFSWLR